MPHRVVACLVVLLALSRGVGDAHAASVPVVAVHADIWRKVDSVTLIDPDTFVVLGTAEFRSFVRPLRFDPPGTSLVLVTAPQSKKKAVTLWSLDTRSLASTPVGELGPQAAIYSAGPNGTRFYAVAGTQKSKRKEISAFDIASLQAPDRLASVERMTAMAVSPDDTLLYAFCEGQAHKKPKGPPGNLHILDARTGAELARLDVGAGASGVAFDVARGLAYVLGASDPEGDGELSVLRGTAVVARLDVRGRPAGLRFAPSGDGYVLTSRAVVGLDTDGLATGHTWELDFGPSDLLFDPGHDSMFAGAGAGSKIAQLGMSTGEVLAVHPTGNPGRKLGKGVGAAVYFLFAVAAAAGGAPVSGSPFSVHNSTSMVLSEGGEALYVLNPYTHDISVFDVAKQDVVDIVHVPGELQRIVQLPDDPSFWVQSRDDMAHFDTATNRVDRTIDFPGTIWQGMATYDTARERAWIASQGEVLVVDLHTGETVGQATLEKPAHTVWIDASRSAEPVAPHP